MAKIAPSGLYNITLETEAGEVPLRVSIGAGPPGPAGADGVWQRMTQAEYDALPQKDPNTLYIITA